MIKKKLQKIFKIFAHILFFKIYGKIKGSISSNIDERIKIEIIKLKNNLEYKVYKVTNGKLYTDRIQDTAIILENKIIEGPSFQLRYTTDSDLKIYNSKIEDNIVFQIGTPRILKKFSGSVLSLLTGGAGNNNYWHWVYDVLPRIELCKKVCNIEMINFFLLPSLEKKFQNETLDFLNIPKKKRLSSKRFRHIEAKELIVTDHPIVVTNNATKDIQNIPVWILDWLKDNFARNIKSETKKNKIYIERDNNSSNDQPARSIINEKEVKQYLHDNNFISVKLGEIEFKQQVNLFKNADCIIGLHGAGFANLAFCEPGTKIIELKSSNAGPVIENLAKKNNLNYNSLNFEAKQVYKYNFPNQQGHINVSIDGLNKILKKY